MNTLQDARYIQLITNLKAIRRDKKLNQADLATLLGKPQSYIAKVEGLERKLDLIELVDWLAALSYELRQFLVDIGWLSESGEIIPVPVRGHVIEVSTGVLQQLVWQGQIKEVLLEGITKEQYLRVEQKITELFTGLNESNIPTKNREAIASALQYAIAELPDLNPSDIYHHIIYRMYLREYRRSRPDQSWVRAGGEAIELFIERHYNPLLEPYGIYLQALLSTKEKAKALREMGLSDQVGDSKLDVAIYGIQAGKPIIFGGIHSKASLAERVSDDVPCSIAMMNKGFTSVLYTFDAKSFPPPHGDLVNRGELGSNDHPSDKRLYIELHGSFDACFSYNLRTRVSNLETKSGNRIFVSSLKQDYDHLL